ncbi:response regulator transcription factor [Planomonospora venezuelensis]|uniref:Two-component system response regulator DesR n=1 Tax=Planomonospora venezuelensis TaxID=1999 RepID=A0A841D8L3_PLAVE|nr:response regulator transcription factor [Planomonospora venezuelensis]MBB5964927.1 two-component system response regulator DesR [Planomonospora venezuelensis]GIM99515.1 DNA-binding response regulator [Planomonospora venezuelensis]
MISVLIAEDMHLIRGAMMALLSAEQDITVVDGVGHGDKVVDACLRHRPDVALVDIGLPGTDGITSAAELHRRLPSCRTVILTGLATPTALRRALAAGACGFFVKDTPAGQLAECVRRVAGGEQVVDSDLAVAALNARENPLTSRELEVLRVAAEGAPVGEIADRLFLSGGTVRNYLSRILSKIGARTRVEAIRIAKEDGWLWPDDVAEIGMVRYRSRT